MKLLLPTTLVVATFFSVISTSYAKTEGNYAGLNLTQTRVSFYQKYTDTDKINGAVVKPSFSETKNNIGVGFNYKYAFNFNKIFIAPGVFFDYLNSKANGKDSSENDYGFNDHGSQIRVKAKNRYGVKIDFGYDINETLAPYFTLGRSYISYNTQNPTLDFDGNSISNVRSTRANAWIYGAGLNVNYNDNYSFNVEYNRQSFLAKTTMDIYMGSLFLQNYKYKTTLQTLRLGITRKF